MHELLSNSLKYAFPDGRAGTVHLSLVTAAHQATLSVGDDGIGLPESFDIGSSASLGLRLVTDLARQLRGTLQIDRDQGTHFSIQFPVAN